MEIASAVVDKDGGVTLVELCSGRIYEAENFAPPRNASLDLLYIAHSSFHGRYSWRRLKRGEIECYKDATLFMIGHKWFAKKERKDRKLAEVPISLILTDPVLPLEEGKRVKVKTVNLRRDSSVVVGLMSNGQERFFPHIARQRASLSKENRVEMFKFETSEKARSLTQIKPISPLPDELRNVLAEVLYSEADYVLLRPHCLADAGLDCLISAEAWRLSELKSPVLVSANRIAPGLILSDPKVKFVARKVSAAPQPSQTLGSQTEARVNWDDLESEVKTLAEYLESFLPELVPFFPYISGFTLGEQ